MILCFTGTGNSLYAAKQLYPELFSIPQVIHRAQQLYEAESIGIDSKKIQKRHSAG